MPRPAPLRPIVVGTLSPARGDEGSRLPCPRCDAPTVWRLARVPRRRHGFARGECCVCGHHYDFGLGWFDRAPTKRDLNAAIRRNGDHLESVRDLRVALQRVRAVPGRGRR